MLCNECDKRNICTKLCKAAEDYANQDSGEYHKRGEKVHFTPTEKKILSLLARGKTKGYIKIALSLSQDAFDQHIHNLRKKSEHILL